MKDLKIPPSSTEAERACLGAILLDTAGRGDDRVMDLCMTGQISPETFYDPRNRIIYKAMTDINHRSKPLDAVTLIEELKVTNMLEAAGGLGYIENLLVEVPTTAHAEHYIKIIRGKHLRRMMIDRAAKVVEKCYDEQEYPDPRAVLGEAEKSFLEIGVESGSKMSWGDAVEESYKRIGTIFDSGGKTLEGLSTGLTHLDEKLQGLKNSEMIVIAARPSVGKTSLAMNIAESCALGRDMNNIPVKSDGGKKHPVLVFSLEMPVEALSKRMLAGRAHVNMWRLQRNMCTRREKENMNNDLCVAADELREALLYVDDTAGLDVMDLRARARRYKKQCGIELIVIDYLQLCCCREYARQGRQIEVSQISQQIKAMAKELKIPVIVLSQLSRANEQRGDKFERPKLSDLRDSGAIEQDADVVFLLRRPSRTPSDPDSADETLAIIDVAKNRNGETGEVKVDFIKEYVRFRDREIPRSEESNFQTSEPPPIEHSEYITDPLI
jgi:replicative DNA helicase